MGFVMYILLKVS